jgi:hypothetical protein
LGVVLYGHEISTTVHWRLRSKSQKKKYLNKDKSYEVVGESNFFRTLIIPAVGGCVKTCSMHGSEEKFIQYSNVKI